MPYRQYSGSDLKQKIELLVKTRVSDAGGGVAETYGSASPPIKIWARIEPTNASESWYAEQLSSTERLTIVIRYRKDVDQTMRIQYGQRGFQILGITDIDQRHCWLQLMCEERQAG